MPSIRLAKYAKVSVRISIENVVTVPELWTEIAAAKKQWFDDSSEDIRSLCGKALRMLHAQYGWEVRVF
jgi:hypothetical protein